jgi:hypothetical protein
MKARLPQDILYRPKMGFSPCRSPAGFAVRCSERVRRGSAGPASGGDRVVQSRGTCAIVVDAHQSGHRATTVRRVVDAADVRGVSAQRPGRADGPSGRSGHWHQRTAISEMSVAATSHEQPPLPGTSPSLPTEQGRQGSLVPFAQAPGWPGTVYSSGPSLTIRRTRPMSIAVQRVLRRDLHLVRLKPRICQALLSLRWPAQQANR